MTKEELTIEELQYWQGRMEELKTNGFTKIDWCNLGHELMEKHGLSEKDAVAILHSKLSI